MLAEAALRPSRSETYVLVKRPEGHAVMRMLLGTPTGAECGHPAAVARLSVWAPGLRSPLRGSIASWLRPVARPIVMVNERSA